MPEATTTETVPEEKQAQPAFTQPEVATPEERPAWLPSQFERPEDLAHSYSHAQRKITEQGQNLSELARENERLSDELERLLAAREELSTRIALVERAFITTMAGGAR